MFFGRCFSLCFERYIFPGSCSLVPDEACFGFLFEIVIFFVGLLFAIASMIPQKQDGQNVQRSSLFHLGPVTWAFIIIFVLLLLWKLFINLADPYD
jgi:hypothetical protein